jgi:hypothetical protein
MFLSNVALKTAGCGVDSSNPGYGTDSLCSQESTLVNSENLWVSENSYNSFDYLSNY